MVYRVAASLGSLLPDNEVHPDTRVLTIVNVIRMVNLRDRSTPLTAG
jgi:hypothetical protein